MAHCTRCRAKVKKGLSAVAVWGEIGAETGGQIEPIAQSPPPTPGPEVRGAVAVQVDLVYVPIFDGI